MLVENAIQDYVSGKTLLRKYCFRQCCQTTQQYCSATINLNPPITPHKLEISIVQVLTAPCMWLRRSSGPANWSVYTQYASHTV